MSKCFTWVSVNIDNTCYHDLMDVPAIYAVYGDGELLYIGSTRKLKSRIRNHRINNARYSAFIRTPWGYFNEVILKYRRETELGEAAMAEIKLINRVKPPENKIYI